MKWRHLVATSQSMPTATDLDHYGSKGWELVQILPSNVGGFVLYFKGQYDTKEPS